MQTQPTTKLKFTHKLFLIGIFLCGFFGIAQLRVSPASAQVTVGFVFACPPGQPCDNYVEYLINGTMLVDTNNDGIGDIPHPSGGAFTVTPNVSGGLGLIWTQSQYSVDPFGNFAASVLTNMIPGVGIASFTLNLFNWPSGYTLISPNPQTAPNIGGSSINFVLRALPTIPLSGSCVAGSNQVTINWTTNPTYTSYNLQVSGINSYNADGSLQFPLILNGNVGNVGSYTFAGAVGSTYYAVVRGQNSTVTSPWYRANSSGGNFSVACIAAPPLPDLIVVSPLGPTSATVGQVVTFSAIVRNAGAGSILSTQTRFRLDVGNNGSWDVTPPDALTGALLSNAQETETWSNAWTATAGTHRYEVCADEDNARTESNEGNNCTTQNLVVGAGSLPDLVVQSPSHFPVSPTVGTPIDFSGIIRNSGLAAAGASTARLRIDTNSNGSFLDASDVSLTTATSGLAVNATETETWNNAWAPTAIGTFPYQICADDNSALTESNEGNNCTTQNLVVAAVPPPGTDEQLILNGSFIAMRGFELKRNPLTVGIPGEIFNERPDFMITIISPTFDPIIRQILVKPNYSWQEIVP